MVSFAAEFCIDFITVRLCSKLISDVNFRASPKDVFIKRSLIIDIGSINVKSRKNPIFPTFHCDIEKSSASPESKHIVWLVFTKIIVHRLTNQPSWTPSNVNRRPARTWHFPNVVKCREIILNHPQRGRRQENLKECENFTFSLPLIENIRGLWSQKVSKSILCTLSNVENEKSPQITLWFATNLVKIN